MEHKSAQQPMDEARLHFPMAENATGGLIAPHGGAALGCAVEASQQHAQVGHGEADAAQGEIDGDEAVLRLQDVGGGEVVVDGDGGILRSGEALRHSLAGGAEDASVFIAQLVPLHHGGEQFGLVVDIGLIVGAEAGMGETCGGLMQSSSHAASPEAHLRGVVLAGNDLTGKPAQQRGGGAIGQERHKVAGGRGLGLLHNHAMVVQVGEKGQFGMAVLDGTGGVNTRRRAVDAQQISIMDAVGQVFVVLEECRLCTFKAEAG